MSPGRMPQTLVLGISLVQLRWLLLIPLLSKEKIPYVFNATPFQEKEQGWEPPNVGEEGLLPICFNFVEPSR